MVIKRAVSCEGVVDSGGEAVMSEKVRTVILVILLLLVIGYLVWSNNQAATTLGG